MASTLKSDPSLCSTSLSDVLERLNRQGYNLIYSHQLVKPWMQVLNTVYKKRLEKEAIQEMLVPYGLRIVFGPKESLLIVRDKKVSNINTQIIGRVVNLIDYPMITSGRIVIDNENIQADIDTEGCFLLTGVPPGAYRLHIHTKDSYYHIEKTLHVTSGQQQQLDISAQPLSIRLIEELIIAGTHFQFSRDVNKSAINLSQHDISNIPRVGRGARSVLKRLPGVTSIDDFGIFGGINLRGGGVNEVRTVIDGVEILNPYFIHDVGGGVFSAIDTDIVNSLTVLTGAYSAEYGNALSGIVNVDTTIDLMNMNRTKIGIDGGVLSTVYGKTEGVFFEGELEYLLFSKRGSYDNGDPILDLNYDADGAPTFKENFLKINYMPSEQLHFSFNILEGKDKSKLEVARLNNKPTFSGKASSHNIWLRADSYWSKSLSSYFIMSHASDERYRQSDAILDRRNASYFGIQAHAHFQFHPRFLLKSGFQWRNVKAKYHYFADFNLMYTNTDEYQLIKPFYADIDVSPKGNDMSVYMSLQTRIQDNWLLETGIRWEQQTYIKDDKDHYSPRINAIFDINENSTFHLGWGRFYQVQNINELPIAQGMEEFQSAQLAEHFVAGFSYHVNQNLHVKIDIYRKKYRKLQPRFEDQQATTLMLFPETDNKNTSTTAQAQGVELSLQHDINESVSWWSNYSYSEAIDTFGKTSVPRAWDQPHTFNIGLNGGWRNWQFNTIVFYHTGKPTVSGRRKALTENDEQGISFDYSNTSIANRFRNVRGHSLGIFRSWSFANGHEVNMDYTSTVVSRAGRIDKVGLTWIF